ncbi:MAG TPA: hypothetical protein VF256_04220, partial [Streptosporangiaceae bacterium]
MVLDLVRAALAAAAAGVLPGYFWAVVLRPTGGLAERLTYSTVLSMASVPAVALTLAKLAGSGITLWIALGSVALVLGSGALVFVVRGAAPGSAAPVLPRPAALTGTGTLVLIAAALAAALASLLHVPASGLLLIAVAGALAVAGVFAARALAPAAAKNPGPAAEPNPGPATDRSPSLATDRNPGPVTDRSPGPVTDRPPRPATGRIPGRHAASAADRPAQPARTGWRALALSVVLGLVAVRAYAAVIRFDWPYVRGSDQFSYAIMAEQLLSHGSYGTFLVYPPGFSTLTAVFCRISGLTPLTLFPVLAPSLLVLVALGAYALATRLWGWEYGVVAAALTGLVLTGAHTSLTQGRYPDLTAAFFLMVMLVAALITLYESPSVRSGLLVTVVGASVVLYHPVVSLYMALLLALVAVIGLPYLLLKRRRHDAGVLLLALVAVVVLSACYAAYTYNLGDILTGSSATSAAVTSVLGTQAVPAPAHLLTELGPAIVWLGVFGIAALAAGIRYLRTPAQVLAAITVLGWSALMYLGSRTALDGFPQRFERDLGASLCIAGALGVGIIVRSVAALQTTKRTLTVAASLAAGLMIVLVGLPAAGNVLTDSDARGNVVSHAVARAGEWLRQHNTGGTIISTPGMNHGITNRAVLALGGYTGLQSYFPRRLRHPRSLPPAGRQPLLDSAHVLSQPVSCRSADILVRDDVRYVVLYKFGKQADFAGFSTWPRHRTGRLAWWPAAWTGSWSTSRRRRRCW